MLIPSSSQPVTPLWPAFGLEVIVTGVATAVRAVACPAEAFAASMAGNNEV